MNRIVAIFSVCIVIGLCFYAAHLGEVDSYLSDNPDTCINCHVMSGAYNTWKHSAHARVANCNDCHVPQTNVFEKYAYKMTDGVFHSFVFTTRTEPEVIRAKEHSQEVIKNNCIRCHQSLIHDPKLAVQVAHHKEVRDGRQCWECHRQVPHGKITSLSSTTIFQERKFGDSVKIIPNWMKEQIK